MVPAVVKTTEPYTQSRRKLSLIRRDTSEELLKRTIADARWSFKRRAGVLIVVFFCLGDSVAGGNR